MRMLVFTNYCKQVLSSKPILNSTYNLRSIVEKDDEY